MKNKLLSSLRWALKFPVWPLLLVMLALVIVDMYLDSSDLFCLHYFPETAILAIFGYRLGRAGFGIKRVTAAMIIVMALAVGTAYTTVDPQVLPAGLPFLAVVFATYMISFFHGRNNKRR